MKWFQKIEEWKSGIPQEYPSRMTTPFFFETFRCDKGLMGPYKEKYIKTDLLNFKQDYSAFRTHISKELKKKNGNKHVITFMNLPKDALMVIPMPRANKDYGSIKAFTDNASYLQQRHLWRQVALSIEELLKTNDCVYVSTHGLGVPYLHVRLDLTPKYYRTKEFI